MDKATSFATYYVDGTSGRGKENVKALNNYEHAKYPHSLFAVAQI
jgi:hypothetical protein